MKIVRAIVGIITGLALAAILLLILVRTHIVHF